MLGSVFGFAGCVVVLVVAFWLSAVVLFTYSLFISLSILLRNRAIVAAVLRKERECFGSSVRDSVHIIMRDKSKYGAVKVPWSAVIAHCCGLPCAMLSYMVLHIAKDYEIVSLSVRNLFSICYVPSAYIVISFIMVNLAVLTAQSYIAFLAGLDD